MPVVLTYSGGIGHYTRGYIKGFYTDSDYPITGLSDHTLQLTQVGFDVLINLVIQSRFYTPNSNHYSTDFIFDAAASQAYYLGVPYLAAFDVTLVADPGDQSWRIGVRGSLVSGPVTRADLPPLPHYWRPL
jgi:hypothetical protein